MPLFIMTRLLTVKEVSKLLNVSLSSAYALIQQGALRAFRVGAGGGGLRVQEVDLEAFLKEREVGVRTLPTPPTDLRHIKL